MDWPSGPVENPHSFPTIDHFNSIQLAIAFTRRKHFDIEHAHQAIAARQLFA